MTETSPQALEGPAPDRHLFALLLLAPLPFLLIIGLLIAGVASLIPLAGGQNSVAGGSMGMVLEIFGYLLSIPFTLGLCLAPVGIILFFTRWARSRNRFVNVLIGLDIAVLALVCVGVLWVPLTSR